jgi:serine phosphatase RsbU (regulator of sigma subunit)
VLSEDPVQPIHMAVAGHPPPLLIDGEDVSEAASAFDPVLGAFADADWEIARCEVEPGQQLVIVTDGITEAQGPEGRFGEARMRGELSGASNPALVLQRLEASLHSFTNGALDDDVTMLAIARASTETEGRAMRPVPTSASREHRDA